MRKNIFTGITFNLLRAWLVSVNKRYAILFSFGSIRNIYLLKFPGTKYTLKYRMLVYDNIITPLQAEEAWKNFALMPDVKFERLGK